MGYVQAFGACLVCRAPFGYNPVLVPSHPAVRDVPGGPMVPVLPDDPRAPFAVREPICSGCIVTVNAERVARGLEPWPVPEGAYEPADEHTVF